MIKLGGLVSQKAFGKFEMGKVVSNPFAKAFVNEAEGEDHEVSMGQNQLDTIIKMATELKAKMGEDEKDIPAWIQDHIAKAENYISQASSNYHEYGTNESVNEAFNVRDLPTWLFDDADDFEYWYEHGMTLGGGKGKIAPFNSSDDKKLEALVEKWKDAEYDYQHGRGDLGTGKTTGARAASYAAQDAIKQLFKQKGKVVKNESINEAPNGKEIAALEKQHQMLVTKGSAIMDKQRQLIKKHYSGEFPWENYDKWPNELKIAVAKLETEFEKNHAEVQKSFQKLMKSKGTWKTESIKEASPCWKGYKQVGMKDKGGRQVPNCVPNESVVNEASRVPKMYVKYMAVQKKVNELEAAQKAMATKYFAEKELNKKAKMLQDLKKGTEQLASYRRNLAAIEDKYITGLYADAEYEGE